MNPKQVSGSPGYTLYHHPYSVCSIMVRYTLAVAGSPQSPDEAIDVEERVVNIFAGEQLEENFLEKVNNKGLVPVLVSPAWAQPLSDSLEITLYIAERYPSLNPPGFQDKVKKLLFELHDLNYFSLSFGARPQQADRMLAAVDERLNQDISDKYREALRYKRQYTLDHKWNGVQPYEIERNEAKARSLMKKFDGLLVPNKQWLFGLAHPTALDAHLVIFIARMRDISRVELLTPALLEYLDSASETEEFKHVMDGRTTMIQSNHT